MFVFQPLSFFVNVHYLFRSYRQVSQSTELTGTTHTQHYLYLKKV